MPGTRFVLENDEGSEISFIGSELHGMVLGTTFRCTTTTDSPDLSIDISAVSIRNSADNADTDNFTFDGHPIYTNRWDGINLDGSFLDPDTVPDAPPASPKSEYNSETAENTQAGSSSPNPAP